MPPRKKQALDLKGMSEALSSSLRRVAHRPNLWGYEPHAKQIRFHSSPSPTRLYIGGNRSGKTVGGCVEDIWWLMGNHPYRKTPPPPIRGRIIGVDFDNGVEKILKPEIARWIPPSALVNGSWEDSFEKQTRTLRLENGSFLEFMSYVQDVDKFAGTSRHFVHYDEEPPRSIYGENKLRLLDTGGHEWFTMTPVQGMTWIYDDIFLPGVEGHSPYIDVIVVDISENPFISEVEIERVLTGLDPNEKRARKKGEFVQMGGLVFKSFNIDRHVIDPIPVKKLMNWRWIASMDHGFNNPSAWLWHAISPTGHVVTFHEHYQNEWTVEQHAAEIHRINRGFGRAPELFVGDPAIKQRSATTGHSIQTEYIKHGIPIALANNDVRSGIDRMNNYLIHPEGYWFITENCPNLIREMRRYRWKTHESAKLRDRSNVFEEPHKKDDHAVDSARYFFTFMPELSLPKEEPKENRGSRIVSEAVGPVTPWDIDNPARDARAIYTPPTENTEWTHIDEHMGGIF